MPCSEVLTIRSTVDVSSKAFQQIMDPATRNTALSLLPPLPTPVIPILPSLPTTPLSSPLPLPVSPKPPTPTGPSYPTYSLTSHHPSLPLPPRPHASTPTKPPLPPRPRPGAGTHPAAGSRLSNPFASLFGRTATTTPPASPTTTPSPLQAATSPVTSEAHGHAADGTEHVIGVPTFTLSRKINRRNVARDILRVIHGEIRSGLAPSGAPGWVAERIEEFAERESLLPFVKSKSNKNKLEESHHLGGYVICPGMSKDEAMDDVGRRFQDFYSEIEDQLVRRKWRGRRSFGKGLVLHHLNGSSISSSADSMSGDEKESIKEDGEETEKESEAEERPEDETEKKIRAVVEAVERTICAVFYDRYARFRTTYSQSLTSCR